MIDIGFQINKGLLSQACDSLVIILKVDIALMFVHDESCAVKQLLIF